MTGTVATQRLAYMDNLRALAMLAGVLFHAGLAYSPLAHGFFPTADRQNASIMDAWLWFLHLFRMPLFLFLSGYLCTALIERRGMAGFLRNRLRRIVLPFLLFWPIMYYALKASTEAAALSVVHPSPVLAFIRPFLMDTNVPSLPPSTSHLWFLYYLIIFALLTWAGRVLGAGKWLAWFIARPPFWHWAVFPLLLVPALYSVSAPHPAPESFLPQFWALGFYGLFFAYGMGMYGRWTQEGFRLPHAGALLLGSLFLYALFAVLLKRQIESLQSGQTASAALHLMIALQEAYISVWMTLASLAFGKALLDRSASWLRYLSDASYWTYLVHLPVLFVIQYRLMDLAWAWPWKFAFSVLACLAICLLSHHWLVRRTFLDRVIGRGNPVNPG